MVQYAAFFARWHTELESAMAHDTLLYDLWVPSMQRSSFMVEHEARLWIGPPSEGYDDILWRIYFEHKTFYAPAGAGRVMLERIVRDDATKMYYIHVAFGQMCRQVMYVDTPYADTSVSFNH
jgi:hypothetical protein